MAKLIIFDLDGTVLDTLQDLSDADNAALSAHGFPLKTLSEVRSFIGDGIRKLIARSVPADTPESTLDALHETFTAWYTLHCADHTAPYPGIPELLVSLRESGLKTALVSNKADDAVQTLVGRYFPGLFDAAAGEKAGIRRKPAPDSIRAVLQALSVSPEDAVYIGDSEVDIETAANAGMDCISVTWGFRDAEFLLARGARTLVDSAAVLEDLLLLPKPVREALSRLEAAGHHAYIVGGCVRDRLLGKLPHDYDITTSAKPQETEAVFADERLIETGLKHGTVTVLLGCMPLEITTYRLESAYSDNRHPDAVSFTDSLREDLVRRDFTVNAMALGLDGQVIDCFGGREDLEKHILRCVGSPEERFREDALRILRALRFASVLGFTIEPETAAAIHRCRELLRNVSAERILSELKKLLCGSGVLGILLEYPDVLGVFLPELLPAVGFDQHNYHHCYDVWTHTAHAVDAAAPGLLLRTAALLHDLGKPLCFSLDESGTGHFYGHAQKSAALARACLTRLKAERALIDETEVLVLNHDTPLPEEPRLIRRWLGRLTPDGFFRLLALQRADNLAQAPEFRDRQQILDRIEAAARELLAEDACFSLKDLAVNGKDLMAAGIPAGKQLGAELRRLLEAVMDGTLPNEKAALLAAVKERKGE